MFDHGADALADAHLIGVDAHVRDVLEAVHVMVDERRSHQAPGRVEDPGAGGDGNLRRQSGDAVVADGHVELVLEERLGPPSDTVVDRLGAAVAGSGHPGEHRSTVAPRDRGRGVDQRVGVPAAAGTLGDE